MINFVKARTLAIILLILISIFCASLIWSGESAPLHLIHITDVHFNHPKNRIYWDTFVNSREWQNVDVVVDTGDFTDKLTPDILANLQKVPQIFVYGNHEAKYNSIPYLRTLTPQISKVRDWTIISLPWWKGNSQDVVGWLRLTLDRVSGPVVIATHAPLVYRDAEHQRFCENEWPKGDPFSNDREREQLLQVISDSGNVVAVLSGHQHQNFVGLYHGIVFISTTPLNYGYRIIEIQRNSISSTFVLGDDREYETSPIYRFFPKTFSAENLIIGVPIERNFEFSWKENL